MKRILFLIAFVTIIGNVTAQDRGIARGTEPGELYLLKPWYGIHRVGPPFYDTMQIAIYHITKNGKKISIQYDFPGILMDAPIPPDSVMIPQYILADATPGTLYTKCIKSKSDGYSYTQLWVSFDYGENWIFREENKGQLIYLPINIEGVIYKGDYGVVYKSVDYGKEFAILENLKQIGEEPGLTDCDFFSIIGRGFYHTYDCFQNYINITIDKEYVGENINGIFPDVFRGGKESEVYITSWFPDWTYKVSFSADMGYIFRHVYISEVFNPYFHYKINSTKPIFMSDREPGVFYIVRCYDVDDFDPWGVHTKMCIYYYRDYGETLEAVFCHDLEKDFLTNYCLGVMDLQAEVQGNNNVLLKWNIPETDNPISCFRIYRNDELLQELQGTTYFDQNLPDGSYTYHVKALYADGCETLSYNIVTVKIGTQGIGDVAEAGGILVYPNPTGGMINVQCLMINVQNVEIFDVFGRTVAVETHGRASLHQTLNVKPETTFDLSNVPSGIYFIRIQTENSVVVKKIVKQ